MSERKARKRPRPSPRRAARARRDSPPPEGRYAYDGLDRVLHEKARLGILTSLVAHPGGLLFSDLKRLCRLTDGNLSRHIGQLREAGLLEVWKGFEERRPQTLCRLTGEGRKRFEAYLAILARVVEDALPAAREAPEAEGEVPPDWVLV